MGGKRRFSSAGVLSLALCIGAFLSPTSLGQVTSNEASEEDPANTEGTPRKDPANTEGTPRKETLEDTVFAEMLRIVDQKFDSLSARISVLERSINSLNFYSVRQFREITQSIEQSTEATEGLRDQIRQMDADDRALKAAVSQVSRDINDIKTDIDVISNDVGAVKRGVDAVSTDTDTTQTTMVAFRSNAEKMLDDIATSMVYLNGNERRKTEELKEYVRNSVALVGDRASGQIKQDTAILVSYLDSLDLSQPTNCSVNFSAIEQRIDLGFAEMKLMARTQFLDLINAEADTAQRERETTTTDDEDHDGTEGSEDGGKGQEASSRPRPARREGIARTRESAEARESGEDRDGKDGEKVMRLLANMTQNVMDAVAYFRHAGDMMERLMATTEGVAIEQTRLRYDVLEASGLLTAGEEAPALPPKLGKLTGGVGEGDDHSTNNVSPSIHHQPEQTSGPPQQPPVPVRAERPTSVYANRTFSAPKLMKAGAGLGPGRRGGSQSDEPLRMLTELARNGTQLLDVVTDLAQLTSTSLTKAVATLHEEVVRLEDVRARLNEGLLLPGSKSSSPSSSASSTSSNSGLLKASGGGELSNLQNTTKTIFTIVEAIASNTGWIPYIFHNMQHVERLTNRTLQLAKRSLLNMHWNRGFQDDGAGISDPAQATQDDGSQDGVLRVTQAEALDVIYETSVKLMRIMPALTKLLAEPEPLMALAEGRTTREGRVDVFYQGRWGAVCQTGMGHAEADAVCRFLGHKGGIWAGDQPVGPGSGHHWQLNMTCLMSPQQLLCPLVLDTGNSTVVECGEGGFTVVCDHMLKITPLPDTGEEGAGLLSLHHRGRWLPVCSHGWTGYEARVACKQMGFRDGRPMDGLQEDDDVIELVTGNVTTWVSGVSCTGDEVSLASCKVDSYRASQCAEGGLPAAVRCQ